MLEVPNNELRSALIKSEQIISENEVSYQRWLSDYSHEKMVIVPISVFRALYETSQIEAINRKIL